MSADAAGGRSVRRVSAFRIVKRKCASLAFSGLGARLYGGRWNSIGTAVVYTAGSLSLAVLEWRVHLAQWLPPALLVIDAGFDETLVWTPAKLPSGWKSFPAPPAVAAFGDDWVNSRRSVVMRVPSAIVPQECNYLLNPGHPDFAGLVLGEASLFRPDTRLGPVNP